MHQPRPTRVDPHSDHDSVSGSAVPCPADRRLAVRGRHGLRRSELARSPPPGQLVRCYYCQTPRLAQFASNYSRHCCTMYSCIRIARAVRRRVNFLGGGSPMPLARIFTHHPERTTSLSEELRQQGYQVEVRSPDQTHLAPADLEIEFEICDRADVLKRAA